MMNPIQFYEAGKSRVKIPIETVLNMPLNGDLLDYSGLNNHATQVGTSTFLDAGLVTSTGNYAYIPNTTTLDFEASSLSFGCQVKFTGSGTLRGILGKTVQAAAVGRYGLYLTNDSLHAFVQITVNVDDTYLATALKDNQWHKLLCIIDRTSGYKYLYIDDILVNTRLFGSSTNNVLRNARFQIGAYGNATGTGIVADSEFIGSIKQVFAVKRIISIAESHLFLK